MRERTPSFLLQNPEQVAPQAPWCGMLDNLELGILLLVQPWVAGEGIRRADLERQLARLAADLPLGPIYFQRVKRAVAELERSGALRGLGEGRARRFVLAPEGFAALLLNLCVLRDDPTLDGGEFELKRGLVAMLHLMLERLPERPEELPLSAGTEEFFAAVEALTVLGERVVTEKQLGEALDVLRLIALQRERVAALLGSAWDRLDRVGTGALDLSRLDGPSEAAALLAEAPEEFGVVQDLALGVLPRLSLTAMALRYEKYLLYLDELAALYAAELGRVERGMPRRFLAVRRG